MGRVAAMMGQLERLIRAKRGGEWGWAVGKWSRRPQQSLTDTDTRNFSSREFNEANIIHKYLGLDV